MKMVAITALLWALSPSSFFFVEREESPPVISRDLSLYDKAGPFDFSGSVSIEKLSHMRTEFKRFLWTHWKMRRLANVQATFYSKEGESSVSNIFVEKDLAGQWQIVVETRQAVSNRMLWNPQIRYENHIDTYQLVDRIERLKFSREGPPKVVPIPDSKETEPKDYQIRMRNALTGDERIF